MKSIDPAKTTLGPLTRSTTGYYYELLVQNCTLDTIVLIDHENNKIPIPPVTMTPLAPEAVLIFWRRVVGPSADDNAAGKKITGYTIRIPKHLLLGEGCIYLKSANVVICTEDVALNAVHPATLCNHEVAACEIKQQLMELMNEVPTINLIANDPQGRFSTFYTAIGDMTVDIPVTKLFGEAELKIVFSRERQVKEFTINLDEFLNSTESVLELENCPIPFITTNRVIAENCSGDHQRMSPTQVKQLLKRQTDTFEEQRKQLVEEHKNQLALSERELALAKADLAQAKADLKKLQTEYDAFTSNVSADVRFDENLTRRVKADHAANEEKWKTVGVYGGLAVGAAALIIKIIELGRKAAAFV